MIQEQRPTLTKTQLSELVQNIKQIDYTIHSTLRWLDEEGSIPKATYGSLIAANQQRTAYMSRLFRLITVREDAR